MWEILQGWQQAIGAVVGFIALATAALFNAHLNRKRDDRLQGLDGQLLARSLQAEVKVIVTQLRQLQRFSDEATVTNPLEAAKKIQAMIIPAETIYPQIGAKVGLLGEEAAQATVQFYGALDALRSSIDVQMPELEPTTGASGFYNIVGGEKIASALYRSERLIPNVVDLGSLTIDALEKDMESRVTRSKIILQRA